MHVLGASIRSTYLFSDTGLNSVNCSTLESLIPQRSRQKIKGVQAHSEYLSCQTACQAPMPWVSPMSPSQHPRERLFTKASFNPSLTHQVIYLQAYTTS